MKIPPELLISANIVVRQKFSDFGLITIDVQLANGYIVQVNWCRYSVGGLKLLWEISYFVNGSETVIGNLPPVEVIDNIVRISKY